MKRYFILTLFVVITGLRGAFGQTSDLSLFVKKIKSQLIEMQPLTDKEIDENRYLPVILDGKRMNYKTLDNYVLDDVISLTINLDKNVTLLYGQSGSMGIIQIKTKQKNRDELKNEG